MKLAKKTSALLNRLAGTRVISVRLGNTSLLEVTGLLSTNPKTNFVHVDHNGFGNNGKNLIELSRKYTEAKTLVVLLANYGFMAYVLRSGVTSFVHYRRVPTLWKEVTDGPCKVDENGVIYRLDKPLLGKPSKRLILVFSSMAGKIYTTSLMRHFEQNFPTIQKYMPPGTAVLRIADLGGVVGSYYLNTNALPENEKHIQELIERIRRKEEICADDTILYGVSKGGTAATYHGLIGCYKSLAVDPIFDDEHYLTRWRDSHFVVDVFPKTKREKFMELGKTVVTEKMQPTAIICSERSAQFPYINNALEERLKSKIAFFNSLRSDIQKHPDMGPKTVNIAVMLLSMMSYKLQVPAGMHTVDLPKAAPSTKNRHEAPY